MKAEIRKRLQQTPEEYEYQLMNMWFSWCREKTDNMQSLQKVLTCRPLFNWWQRELELLETEFLEETILLHDKKHARELYAEFVVPIFDRFSKALLKPFKL